MSLPLKSMSDYQKRLITSHLADAIEVKRSTIEGAGKGVFAKKFLPRNFFIPYTGKRYANYDEFLATGNDPTYVMETEEGGMVIDGHPRYNRCKYSVGYRINEPSLKRLANVEILEQKGWSRKVSPIGFRTTRPIQAGEELWSWYGEDYVRDY